MLKRLESELVQIARSADLKSALEKQGLEPNPASAADLAATLKSEIENYRTVFKSANIPVQ